MTEKAYLTDAFAREAVAFVERHKNHPFFLYLAFNAVHTPMHATDERLARFAGITDAKRRTYAAMLTAMDEGVGKVLDALQAANLDQNTLIFFFSDNGGPTMLGTTINGSRNDPLRGSKRTTLEGGIHVPFVVQWKGKLPRGTVYHEPVIQLDILPTALAAAGVEARPEWKFDGVDLLPHLQGQASSPPHETLYWRLGEQWAIRRGDWKLVQYDAAADHSDVRSLGNNVKVTPPRLYNLAQDIGERHDLAADHADTFKELERRGKHGVPSLPNHSGDQPVRGRPFGLPVPSQTILIGRAGSRCTVIRPIILFSRDLFAHNPAHNRQVEDD